MYSGSRPCLAHTHTHTDFARAWVILRQEIDRDRRLCTVRVGDAWFTHGLFPLYSVSPRINEKGGGGI